MKKEITLKEAQRFIEEYGIDPDNYISRNFRQFMNGDMADDNSVESYNYHLKNLKIVVEAGLQQQVSVEPEVIRKPNV